MTTAIDVTEDPAVDIEQQRGINTCLFGPVVVTIDQPEGVWKLTPHGHALGEGMARARHCLVGKTVIEIGVGTGVHAIAALKLGVRTIDVTDIEPAALESAAENARRNAGLGRIVPRIRCRADRAGVVADPHRPSGPAKSGRVAHPQRAMNREQENQTENVYQRSKQGD